MGNETQSYIIFLGVIDTIHDFFRYDKDKSYLNYFIKFVNSEINAIDNFDSDIKAKLIAMENNIPNVNGVTMKNNIKNVILQNNLRYNMPIDNINNQIINNFNLIFDFTINDSGIKNGLKINQLISDDQKLLLRQPLYFLIKKQSDERESDKIINFFLDYMNINIYNDTIIKDIKDTIKRRLSDEKSILKYIKIV